MKHSALIPLSYLAFVLALAAWVGVWFFYSDLSSRIAARAEDNLTVNEQSAAQGNAVEVHALVSDTVTQRTALDTAVNTDVVGIANQINGVGKASGTQTTIGSASLAAALGSTAGVNEIQFVVQSTGTFAQVWRAAQLFATFPLPSKVERFDFEQLPGGNTTSWQLTTTIDVLTSAQISS